MYAIIQFLTNWLVFLYMVVYKVIKTILVTGEIKIVYEDEVIGITVHKNYCCNPYYVGNTAPHVGQK